MEFFVTPFDYAPPDKARAVATQLEEGKSIGMSWAILDYDDEKSEKYSAFWNLSHKTEMYGNASDLVAFQLMPLEKPDLRAAWSFTVLDLDRREVAFHDDTAGATSWKWDFGDGQTSLVQHPVHHYEKPGEYVVILLIDGPAGKSQLSKVWDVVLR